MALIRKRRSDPASDALRTAFDPLAVAVDAAQRALLAAVPTARDEGVPLAQALAAFGARLDQADAALRGWQPALAGEIRRRCLAAVAEAKAQAERLRLDPRALGFEALNAAIGDVLQPLEEVADAEREIRRL